MDEQERNRIRLLMEQYLQGEDSPEARARFDAWFHTMQPDTTADLSKEELQQTMQRMQNRLHAATKQKDTFSIHKNVLSIRKDVFSTRKDVFSTRKNIFSIRRIAAVAAAVIVIIGLSTAFKQNSFLFNILHPVKETLVATVHGESKIIRLTDGTNIHLNENSSLTYTNRYETGPQREISLQGEAFFEVTKNPDHPFIVKAGKAIIKVLGTSFNVSVNKADSAVVVAVRDGLISLQHDKEQLLLPAGAIGMLKEKPVLYTHANIDNYLSWMNGKLVFENAALKDVVAELENIYHVNIRLENTSLEKIHLTLQYKHMPLQVILNVICNSLDLQYADQHGTIIIQSNLQD
jgi:transmembrane sensor